MELTVAWIWVSGEGSRHKKQVNKQDDLGGSDKAGNTEPDGIEDSAWGGGGAIVDWMGMAALLRRLYVMSDHEGAF